MVSNWESVSSYCYTEEVSSVLFLSSDKVFLSNYSFRSINAISDNSDYLRRVLISFFKLSMVEFYSSIRDAWAFDFS